MTPRAFWQQPPWVAKFDRDGQPIPAAKHRLGLRPIAREHWFRDDPGLRANKQARLTQDYGDVVATAPVLQPNLRDWDLPGARATGFADEVANRFAGLSEDVCILDCRADFTLIAASLCAPSYWSLHDKLGKPLLAIHEPVDGMNARLGQRIREFLMRLPVGQPFYRNNWFVHGDDTYFHSRGEMPKTLGDDPACWHFRTEHQVLYKPEPDYLLFTIAVEFAPVAELAAHPVAASALIAALEMMNEDEVRHAGGLAKHQRLHQYATFAEQR